jgi:hypothetical protein
VGQVTPFGSPVVPLVNWMFLEDVNDGGSTVEVAAVHLSVIRERHDPTRRGRIKRSPTQPCFRSNLYAATFIKRRAKRKAAAASAVARLFADTRKNQEAAK